MLVGSGAEKDDFPVFGKVGEPALELLEGERALKVNTAAFGLIGIGAYQERLAGLNPGIDLLWGDACRSGHDGLLVLVYLDTFSSPAIPEPGREVQEEDYQENDASAYPVFFIQHQGFLSEDG
jgi:hypothetical protein